ncbi:MAG: Riboflavin transporter [Alphaproteobacteria bacterium MarineAlpha9_Bin7]|nr:MAG: Riboflavin transporter [Alphaproteobacteria bacterium MarineAlpha9_Bin7]
MVQLRVVSPSVMIRVACWMLLACLCFSMMNGIVRHLGGVLEPIVVVFFRCLFGLIAMAPFLLRSGFSSLRTEKPTLHVIRGFAAVIGMSCWFYGIKLMPLTEAVALSFTTPLFSSIAAVIFLGEVMRRRRWTATVIGFIGTLIVLRPGVEEFSFGSFLILTAALLMAFNQVMVKYLTGKDHPNAIVFWLVFLVLPLSLVPAASYWQTPIGIQWIWLIGLGIIATVGHQSMVRSFALADATAVAPFEFMRLPFVALIAFLAFGENPDVWTWVGAAVIVSSSVYITHREVRQGHPVSSVKAASIDP